MQRRGGKGLAEEDARKACTLNAHVGLTICVKRHRTKSQLVETSSSRRADGERDQRATFGMAGDEIALSTTDDDMSSEKMMKPGLVFNN